MVQVHVSFKQVTWVGSDEVPFEGPGVVVDTEVVVETVVETGFGLGVKGVIFPVVEVPGPGVLLVVEAVVGPSVVTGAEEPALPVGTDVTLLGPGVGPVSVVLRVACRVVSVPLGGQAREKQHRIRIW